MQVSAGNGLKRLRVSNCEEICLSDVQGDRDVGREIEVDWQWQELIEVEEVGVCHHRDVENECEIICCRRVQV